MYILIQIFQEGQNINFNIFSWIKTDWALEILYGKTLNFMGKCKLPIHQAVYSQLQLYWILLYINTAKILQSLYTLPKTLDKTCLEKYAWCYISADI